MYPLPYQKFNIYQPKLDRSLETEVVEVHLGDKQVYRGTNQQSYRYLNRPLPQTTRYDDKGRPNTGLHLLYPTIDSGNVYLSERYWDNRWSPTRENISSTNNVETVKNHREAMFNYYLLNESDNNKALQHRRNTRYRPEYHDPRVTGESLKGVEVTNSLDYPYFQRPQIVTDPSIPSISSTSPYESLANIENYSKSTNISLSNNTSKQTKEGFYGDRTEKSGIAQHSLAFYGYNQPTGYATMGQGYGYNVNSF